MNGKRAVGPERLARTGRRRKVTSPTTRPTSAVTPASEVAELRQLISVPEDQHALADYLIFPASSRWWLEHYEGLRADLDRHYETSLDDEWCRIVRLHGRETAGVTSRARSTPQQGQDI